MSKRKIIKFRPVEDVPIVDTSKMMLPLLKMKGDLFIDEEKDLIVCIDRTYFRHLGKVLK